MQKVYKNRFPPICVHGPPHHLHFRCLHSQIEINPLQNWSLEIQERKSSPKSKFWGRISGGRPRGYPGGRPGAKTSVKPSKSWKNKHCGADVHDPKARTPMTQAGSKKLRSEKLRAEFSFPRNAPGWVHAKGAVLCERTCFCLLGTF